MNEKLPLAIAHDGTPCLQVLFKAIHAIEQEILPRSVLSHVLSLAMDGGS